MWHNDLLQRWMNKDKPPGNAEVVSNNDLWLFYKALVNNFINFYKAIRYEECSKGT